MNGNYPVYEVSYPLQNILFFILEFDFSFPIKLKNKYFQLEIMSIVKKTKTNGNYLRFWAFLFPLQNWPSLPPLTSEMGERRASEPSPWGRSHLFSILSIFGFPSKIDTPSPALRNGGTKGTLNYFKLTTLSKHHMCIIQYTIIPSPPKHFSAFSS